VTNPPPASITGSRRFARRHRRYLRHAERHLNRQWAFLGELLILSGPPTRNTRPPQDWERDWQYQPELLQDIDPNANAPDPGLAWTALEYANTLDTDNVTAYQWTGYAYRVLRQLLGPCHDDTLYAAQTLADACRHQHPEQALTLRQEIADSYQRRGLRASADEARLDLATALHATGRCAAAHHVSAQLWAGWCRRQRPGRRGACRNARRRQLVLGVHIAAHARFLHARCGQPDIASVLLADSRFYLPARYAPGSPLSRRLPWDADPHDGRNSICTITAAGSQNGGARQPATPHSRRTPALR
jgi:hypothetical protein